jgi:predicted component of type VI protein secretion system
MEPLEILLEMRRTLATINGQLTPYSGSKEHQRYLENLLHYQKVLNNYTSRANDEINRAISKSNDIIRGYAKVDIEILRTQIVDG